MIKVKKTGDYKIPLRILYFNIIYVIIFAIYYLFQKNYEFMIYIAVLAFFIALMTILHKRYNFSNRVLIGITIWGLLHMLGGSVYVFNTRLYDLWLLPILKYDQFVHYYCYLVITLILNHILISHIKRGTNKVLYLALLVFAAMGIGSLNEIIEFIPVLIGTSNGVGGYTNTMWDIIFNTLGALTSVFYLAITKKVKYK